MQDKTYDTGEDPDLRLTCAKVHYSHRQDKGHIDSWYKLDRTAPAYMECQVWGGLKENPLDVSGHTHGRADKSVYISLSLVISSLNHHIKGVVRAKFII